MEGICTLPHALWRSCMRKRAVKTLAGSTVAVTLALGRRTVQVKYPQLKPFATGPNVRLGTVSLQGHTEVVHTCRRGKGHRWGVAWGVLWTLSHPIHLVLSFVR